MYYIYSIVQQTENRYSPDNSGTKTFGGEGGSFVRGGGLWEGIIMGSASWLLRNVKLGA